MKFDSYTIIARLFPGILSAIPFFVLHFFFLKPQLGEFWEKLLGFKIASDITISFVFIFALIQLSRFLSKEIFEKYIFDHGQNLPTTDYLLHLNSHFSQEYVNKIHRKIKANFGIEIPILPQEKTDQSKSRKIIGEAISHVRVKVGKGKLVDQHNSEYGFWRNLAGGSIVALTMSAVNIALFHFHYDKVAFWLSIVLFCCYLLYLVFAKRLIISYGRDYAKILIQEYMARS